MCAGTGRGKCREQLAVLMEAVKSAPAVSQPRLPPKDALHPAAQDLEATFHLPGQAWPHGQVTAGPLWMGAVGPLSQDPLTGPQLTIWETQAVPLSTVYPLSLPHSSL